jgi:hypothetical protein
MEPTISSEKRSMDGSPLRDCEGSSPHEMQAIANEREFPDKNAFTKNIDNFLTNFLIFKPSTLGGYRISGRIATLFDGLDRK